MVRLWRETKRYSEEDIDFQERVYAKSGLSSTSTYLPPSLNPAFVGNDVHTDLNSAAEECRMAVCTAIEGLLKKTGVRAEDIDILVTTCSIYCPTPSMASMVVNAFKLRKDVQAYHLGGMGCANGVVAVNLVADMIKARPNSVALFVTTETTTPAYYRGNDRHRLVTNLLFRMGAAAVLLTDKPRLAGRGPKYVLQCRNRVHLGASEEAIGAIHYGPDAEGANGIYLGKNVVKEASRALALSMRQVAPRVLTWPQLAEAAADTLRRRLSPTAAAAPPYRPNFQRSTVKHFLLHAGGAKVLDGLGEALQLGPDTLAPSRAVLHDYGNVSSSTTWYTLAAVETTRGVSRGDRVLQIGVGSGIKCGVNVWKALRDVHEVHGAWAHRLSSEERTRLELAAQVDVSHGWAHVARRLVFMVLMLLLVAAMHTAMLRQQVGLPGQQEL